MRSISIFLVVAVIAIFGVVKPAWLAEWSEVVEAAKREGTVVIVGPQGNETREALTLGFQKKYPEIKVEHSSAAGAQLRLSCSPSRKPSAIPSTCLSRERRR